MNGRVEGAGSGTWLAQRHHDAVAQAAAGMDETRAGRVGEPNSVAATGNWRQANRAIAATRGARTPCRNKAGAPDQQKKRPGPAGALKSAAKALRASDYLPLEAGAEDMAFFA